MKVLIIIIGLILILGPLRKHFFENWRFCVPATISGYLAWFLLSRTAFPQEFWWVPLVISFSVALGAGAVSKEWVDKVFGREK